MSIWDEIENEQQATASATMPQAPTVPNEPTMWDALEQEHLGRGISPTPDAEPTGHRRYVLYEPPPGYLTQELMQQPLAAVRKRMQLGALTPKELGQVRKLLRAERAAPTALYTPLGEIGTGIKYGFLRVHPDQPWRKDVRTATPEETDLLIRAKLLHANEFAPSERRTMGFIAWHSLPDWQKQAGPVARELYGALSPFGVMDKIWPELKAEIEQYAPETPSPAVEELVAVGKKFAQLPAEMAIYGGVARGVTAASRAALKGVGMPEGAITGKVVATLQKGVDKAGKWIDMEAWPKQLPTTWRELREIGQMAGGEKLRVWAAKTLPYAVEVASAATKGAAKWAVSLGAGGGIEVWSQDMAPDEAVQHVLDRAKWGAVIGGVLEPLVKFEAIRTAGRINRQLADGYHKLRTATMAEAHRAQEGANIATAAGNTELAKAQQDVADMLYWRVRYLYAAQNMQQALVTERVAGIKAGLRGIGKAVPRVGAETATGRLAHRAPGFETAELAISRVAGIEKAAPSITQLAPKVSASHIAEQLLAETLTAAHVMQAPGAEAEVPRLLTALVGGIAALKAKKVPGQEELAEVERAATAEVKAQVAAPTPEPEPATRAEQAAVPEARPEVAPVMPTQIKAQHPALKGTPFRTIREALEWEPQIKQVRPGVRKSEGYTERLIELPVSEILPVWRDELARLQARARKALDPATLAVHQDAIRDVAENIRKIQGKTNARVLVRIPLPEAVPGAAEATVGPEDFPAHIQELERIAYRSSAALESAEQAGASEKTLKPLREAHNRAESVAIAAERAFLGEVAPAAEQVLPAKVEHEAVVPERMRISPSARTYADKHEINPEGIKGSGLKGRIVVKDVRNLAAALKLSNQYQQAKTEKERQRIGADMLVRMRALTRPEGLMANAVLDELESALRAGDPGKLAKWTDTFRAVQAGEVESLRVGGKVITRAPEPPAVEEVAGRISPEGLVELHSGLKIPGLSEDLATLVRKARDRLGSLAETPHTTGQNSQLHVLETKYEVPPEVRKGMKLAVSGGRTDSSKDFTRLEADTYIGLLRRFGVGLKQGKEQPTIMAVLAQQPRSENIENAVLRDFFESIDKEIELRRVPPQKVKVGQFWDIDRALAIASEKSGVPFFAVHQETERQYRDNRYDAGQAVNSLFLETGLSFTAVRGNRAHEERIFDYLATGERAAEMSDAEVVIAERMRAIYQSYERGVKRIRHGRWMKTGELPPDASIELMQQGQQVWEQEQQKATGQKPLMDLGTYEEWLDMADFGVRERYVPTHREQQGNIRSLIRRAFGRGYTKTREGEDVHYDPDHPLYGDLYRYVLKALNIERLEPKLKTLEAMFKESAIDPGLIGRYFDNMYGVRDRADWTQTLVMKGMRQFFRVTIPQKIIKWCLRNKLQPVAFVLAKAFFPNDVLFWKSLPLLFAGGAQLSKSKAVAELFGSDKPLKEAFNRYVDSMDAARQHFFFEEFSEFEMPRRLFHLLDEISRAYSWSDKSNRGQSFMYGWRAGTDAIKRFQTAPTKENWQAVLSLTGAQFAPPMEQQRIAVLIDAGKVEEAAFVAAKRLSDSTQFKYPSAERGLAWQKIGTGAHQTSPIATFWKGSVQDLWLDGFDPVLRGLRARAAKRASYYSDQRMANGAQHLLMWYAISLVLNRVYEEIFDVREGQYGLNVLRYVPGGPVIQNWIKGSQAIWGIYAREGGWDYRLASTANEMGKMFLPFYLILNRLYGNKIGQHNFSFPLELRRILKSWAATHVGSMKPTDMRRWVERNAVEQVQLLAFDGSWSTRKADLIEAYYKYLLAESPDERKKLRDVVNGMLRKYPVSTARKDVPREAEHIYELVPDVKRQLGKQYAEENK